MGTCKFCGASAGLLRSEHPECQQKHADAERTVWELAYKLPYDTERLEQGRREIERVAGAGYLPETRVRELVVGAWERAAETALDDRLITSDEIKSLVGYANGFELSATELNRNHWWQRVRNALLLQRLTAGEFPEAQGGEHPFNLQKTERLAWTTPAVAYEQRTKTEYVGSSQGVSLRVTRGVYYRTSAFRGRPVTSSHLSEIGAGTLGLTDKHLYFHSTRRSFRIAYKKIVAFQPFDDGVGVHQEAASAKPVIFVTGDGWSLYNLATNLAQL